LKYCSVCGTRMKPISHPDDDDRCPNEICRMYNRQQKGREEPGKSEMDLNIVRNRVSGAAHRLLSVQGVCAIPRVARIDEYGIVKELCMNRVAWRHNEYGWFMCRFHMLDFVKENKFMEDDIRLVFHEVV